MGTTNQDSRTFTATTAVTQYARVKLDGSTADAVVEAIDTDNNNYYGVALTGAAAGGLVTVAKKGGYRTFKCIASGAITVNAKIYPDTDGEVTATVNGESIGYALEAATADGDLIECTLEDTIDYSGTKMFVAGTTTVTQYARVKWESAGAVVEAVATDKADYLGVALTGNTTGGNVLVALKGGYRTFTCIAEEAFSEGDALYAADDGKVKDTVNGNIIGTALAASTGDEDTVECILLDQVAAV
jgi:predicted RecA/RadA family phage recombinase